jgi:hypothetical protein
MPIGDTRAVWAGRAPPLRLRSASLDADEALLAVVAPAAERTAAH